MKTLIKLFCTKFYKCYLIKLQKYKKKKIHFLFPVRAQRVKPLVQICTVRKHLYKRCYFKNKVFHDTMSYL